MDTHSKFKIPSFKIEFMFDSLPHTFKKHKLNADVRTLLLLRKTMEKGLVKTMGDLFVVLKGIITNDPKDFGPYTTAFYEYFLEIEIKKGEKLENAVARSEAFQKWKKERYGEDDENVEMPDINELIDRYLDEVHVTTFDIKKMLSGKDILNKDDPDRVDDTEQEPNEGPRDITEGADYTDIPLEELLERMRKVAEQQKRRHEGGDHWIGQYGRSPYGQNGAAQGGIRTGGSGGGKMARRVIGDPQFYPVDTKAILKDDNIDAALASLRGIEDETAEVLLDIPKTIKEGLKQGGIFLPYEKEKITQKVQVILMIDNGGYSMHPYIKSVRKLFSKMKTRFAHDLKVYYFHNTLADAILGLSIKDKHNDISESVLTINTIKSDSEIKTSEEDILLKLEKANDQEMRKCASINYYDPIYLKNSSGLYLNVYLDKKHMRMIKYITMELDIIFAYYNDDKDLKQPKRISQIVNEKDN